MTVVIYIYTDGKSDCFPPLGRSWDEGRKGLFFAEREHNEAAEAYPLRFRCLRLYVYLPNTLSSSASNVPAFAYSRASKSLKLCSVMVTSLSKPRIKLVAIL